MKFKIEKPIILIGFMGCGKTTIGKELAKKINYQFVDLDEAVEIFSGLSITDIFHKYGESYFRKIETKLFKKYGKFQNLVISSGGGIIESSANINTLNNGITVYIRVGLDTVFSRLKQISKKRPLFKDEEYVRKLFNNRKPLYEKYSHFIVDGEDEPEIIIQKIVEYFYNQKHKLLKQNEKSIDIFNGTKTGYLIESDLKLINFEIKSFNDIFKNFIKNKKVFFIFDFYFYSIFKENFKDLLTNENFYLINSSEEQKNLYEVNKILNKLINYKLEKEDLLIGAGGGAITDLTGFIGMIYKRGVKTILIPSTLLSQIDASIGLKNGLNFNNVKNLIGGYNREAVTLINPFFFRTCSIEDYYSGFFEMIKTIIGSYKVSGLNDFLSISEYFNERNFWKLFSLVLKSKIEIVRFDPFEKKGVRKLLNFGHTIGHGIESLLEFNIPHGIAVGIGMLLEILILEKEESFLFKKLLLLFIKNNILKKFLILTVSFEEENLNKIINFIIHDKKNLLKYIMISNPFKGEYTIKFNLNDFENRFKLSFYKLKKLTIEMIKDLEKEKFK